MRNVDSVARAAREMLEYPNTPAVRNRFLAELAKANKQYPDYCSDITLHVLEEPATYEDLLAFQLAHQRERGMTPEARDSYRRILDTPHIKLTRCPYVLSQIFDSAEEWVEFIPASVNTILQWVSEYPVTSPALIESCVSALMMDQKQKRYPLVNPEEFGAFLLTAVDKRMFAVIW